MTCDVLVAGAGMAGLTAAAYCARAGLDVVVCEKTARTGGLVGSFTRDGFTFDAGLRAIEDSGILMPMLSQLGLEVPFMKSPVSLGIGDRILPVETRDSLVAYRDMLVGLYPENTADIDAILADIRKIMRDMDVLYGIENPLFKDIPGDREYLVHTLLPWIGRFLVTIGRINRMQTPAESYLETRTGNRSLIDIIAQHFFRDTPAFFAMSYFSLYLDYRYPLGGTGALPEALTRYCREHGVRFVMENELTAIHPLAREATTTDGSRFAYGKLIWTADQKALYRAVDTEALPDGPLRRQVLDRRALLRDLKGSDSVFSLFLSLDRHPDTFRAISAGHFFYTPDPAGLGSIHREELDRLLATLDTAPSGETQPRILEWIRRCAALTTYEISLPVLKDPTLAPPGKTGLIVSILLPYDLCRHAEATGWYEAFRNHCADCMIDALSHSVYPGLRDWIIDRTTLTPLSIARTFGSTDGAITGWSFTNPVMPAVAKMQQVSRTERTLLPDVHQAGQWAYSPAGLPMSILTGKIAADRVVKDLKRRRRSRG